MAEYRHLMAEYRHLMAEYRHLMAEYRHLIPACCCPKCPASSTRQYFFRRQDDSDRSTYIKRPMYERQAWRIDAGTLASERRRRGQRTGVAATTPGPIVERMEDMIVVLTVKGDLRWPA
jgi:hypothetical protein